MIEQNPAEKLFDAHMKLSTTEEEVFDKVLVAAGVDPDEPATWPLRDWSYDWYDESFEWTGVRGGWVPSESTIQAWRELGFARCWMNYLDGSERYIPLRNDKA
jgi:hypothetical protein